MLDEISFGLCEKKENRDFLLYLARNRGLPAHRAAQQMVSPYLSNELDALARDKQEIGGFIRICGLGAVYMQRRLYT